MGWLYPVIGMSGNCGPVVVCSIFEEDKIILILCAFCITWAMDIGFCDGNHSECLVVWYTETGCDIAVE